MVILPPPRCPKANNEAEHIQIVTQLILSNNVNVKELFGRCAGSLEDDDLDTLIARLDEWKADVEQVKSVRTKAKEEKAHDNIIEPKSEELTNSPLAKKSLVPSTTQQAPSHCLDSATSELAIPTEVLRQLLQGDFLSSIELGRLLLLVSKKVLEHIGEDVIWSNLCRRRWVNHRSIPLQLIEQNGPKMIFQQRTLGLPIRNVSRWQDEPSPPTLSAETLVFLISIRTQPGDVEIVSETLSGDSLSQLLATGKTEFSLDKPYVLGEYEMIDDEFVEGEDSPEDATFVNWVATIHCVRLDDNKFCCIHKTNNHFWDEKCGGVLSNSGQISNLHFSTEVMELRNEWTGSMGNRIREHSKDAEQFGGYKLEMDLLCFKNRIIYQNLERGTSTVELQFSHLKLQFWRRHYDGRQGKAFHKQFSAPQNGASLLHILDELQGWDGQ